MKLARWAGWSTVGFGVIHLTITGVLAAKYVPGWFSGKAWGFDPALDLNQHQAFLWVVPGSFGVPMILLGSLILWMARRGITPPAGLGLATGAWALLMSAILVPSGAPFGLIPAALLILAARRAG